MIGGKSHAQQKPTALGTMLQASTYGMTIPTIYGMTKSALLAIWAANIRKGSSGKKGKKAGKKGAPPTYVENVDFLIGSNPIEGVLQVWLNNNTRYILNIVKHDFTLGTYTSSVTISDPAFYFLIGVTADVQNSGTFNDYGAPGSVPYNDTSEFPLYNAAQGGPDIVDASYSKYYPYVYKWVPSDGATFSILFYQLNLAFGIPNGTGNFHAYYAQLVFTGAQTPIGKLRLTFENELGNGSEYSGFTSQQIIYPHFAGAGSPNIDLGASGMLPNIKPEIKGSFARWPSGDADFADMIEDVMKSGLIQVGTQLGEIHRGVNLNNYPGPVQKICYEDLQVEAPQRYWFLPQGFKKNSTLVAFYRFQTSNAIITDSAGNSWTAVYNNTPPGSASGLWYAVAAADTGPRDVISTGASQDNDCEAYGLVFDPSLAVDTTSTANGASGTASCSITVSGSPTIIIASVNAATGLPGSYIPYHWKSLFVSGFVHTFSDILYRVVYAPGTYTFTVPTSMGTSAWQIGMMAFKLNGPSRYAKSLGDILDQDSLNLVRAQDQAYGLYGSISMDSQKKAADWLKEFYQCANAAPVWSGFKLKSIPWAEASFVGNGRVYVSPTASGPVADFSESDFIGDGTNPPVTVERKAQVDRKNVFQIQHTSRISDYNALVTSQPDAGSVALYGPRKAAPITLASITDAAVARRILSVIVRRSAYIGRGQPGTNDNTSEERGNTYSFTLNAKWQGVEAMDLVTLTEPLLGLSKLPVRLTKVEEDEQFRLKCEAEPFFYGVNSPSVNLAVTQPSPYKPNSDTTPASVNTPIIFEPVPRLSANQNQNQLWLVVSDSDPNYGGCQVQISTDGGSSYNYVGEIIGNAITGVTTATWAAASDPDTTNDLLVDLTESLGTLASYQVADEDNFVYPCYVAGGNASIPYELMTYAVATLGSANHYTLKATGGNHLRRAVFGAPAVGAGVSHASSSRFAFLGASGQGILKLTMDPLWIGKTLHFKFLAFNTFAGGLQSLSSATDYTYTPTGTVGSFNPNFSQYSISGGALTNPTSTSIAMAQATATWLDQHQSIYNARTFTITAPVSATTYYVTIYDPAMLGDNPGATNLTATCSTSNANVGKQGYVYIGSITVLPAGGGAQTSPGGAGGVSSNPVVIGFIMNSGATGTNVGPELCAPRAGSVTKCKITTKTSDGSTDLTIKIKQNGTDVFSVDPTVAHATAAGTVSTFTALTSSPLSVAADDVFTIDITSGTSSWVFTAQLE